MDQPGNGPGGRFWIPTDTLNDTYPWSVFVENDTYRWTVWEYPLLSRLGPKKGRR
jgi:hypothetical protein